MQCGPDTPKYNAWTKAERKAAEADQEMRQSCKSARRGSLSAMDRSMEADAAELRDVASSLFEEAIREMHLAVEAVLQNTHSRLN